jgi:SAM-dependent methyltransferase
MFNSILIDLLSQITKDKYGIEIGGPSNTIFVDTIYKNALILDNVIFSNNTIWSKQAEDYHYYKNKKGKVIINEAIEISLVDNEKYDFCFACHCLEHIANPIKAIKEWLRIIKENGYIIIIVPEKSYCFDHKRNYSSFSVLLKQYEKNVGEDDLSTLPDILVNHDLSMDLPAGNFEQFTLRSLNNVNNRCLHHYVYNPELLINICNYLKCKFIYTFTNQLDIWFIMQKTTLDELETKEIIKDELEPKETLI